MYTFNFKMRLSRWIATSLGLVTLLTAPSFAAPPRPHIIYILGDDLGWNDVSYHGMNEIYTPNIDTLAAAGVLLNNYYTLPVCTPSRTALLTGLYPIRTGLQHYVIPSAAAEGIPLNLQLLPQRLKGLGYQTSMIGKWHLGFFWRNYTPTYRGFDYHYGYWSGLIDYFQHTAYNKSPAKKFINVPNNLKNDIIFFNGQDLWENMDPVKGEYNVYATDLFTRKAVDVIDRHDNTKPLFMYLSHLAVHRGTPALPVIAPKKYTEKYWYIHNSTRRNFAGALTALDQSIGKVMQALLDRNMLQYSIIIFSADNGAQVTSDYLTGGSNYPLRGEKNNNWEGGIRVSGMVWSPFLTGRVSNGMMHMVDWLPTLYSAAGGNVADLGTIDGMDMWPTITQNVPSPRTGFVVNIDATYNTSAIRQGDYKLVAGSYAYSGDEQYPWQQPSGRLRFPPFRPRDSQVLQVFRKFYQNQRLTFRLNLKPIDCGGPPPEPRKTDNECEDNPCLYNIAKDPCEYQNIAAQNPKIVNQLLAALRAEKTVPPQSQVEDYNSDPLTHCGFWDNWLDERQSATFCKT